jgi:uncharacterized protein (TIGR03435 family)
MKKSMILAAALAASFTSALLSQDITGTWQGTLTVQAQGSKRDLRTVVKISKGDNAGLKVVFYSIDQPGPGVGGTAALQGSVVKISLPSINGAYEGKLDSDGVSLTGTWTQGPGSLPLNLKHVTEQQAWAIPTPPPPLKLMAADANPSFEVAVIKPSRPEARGRLYQYPAREFRSLNTSLTDLIVFAYGVHSRQIEAAPSWADQKYDVTAKADGEGKPSQQQWRVMVQKLLADRFKVTLHHEKKELSVYTIVVGKNGPKLTKSEADPNGPTGLLFRGLGNLPARNATMEQFASVMQSAVMDRPVVDQTGLSGHFDFQLTWTPDETQFASLGGAPPPSDSPDAPPDLFTAMQEQLGLKIQVAKAPVDVLIVDRAEKPSEN